VIVADRKPLLLDLYCCQGGAAAGYVAAGFDVIGVDIDPQPRFPYRFIQADAIELLAMLAALGSVKVDSAWLTPDAIHASPPCQAHSNAQKIQGRQHPELIAPVRELLEQTGMPYVIENVPGAPLENPVELCGAMFGLHTYRHRLFESNIPITVPAHPAHGQRQIKMGRPVREGDFYQAVGNFSNVAYARADLGVPWMNRDGIRECIPPVYAEHIGRQLAAYLMPAQAVAS